MTLVAAMLLFMVNSVEAQVTETASNGHGAVGKGQSGNAVLNHRHLFKGRNGNPNIVHQHSHHVVGDVAESKT